MHKLIKHKWEDKDNIYFSSDWHNFHDPNWDCPIWKMRGYTSPEESWEDVLTKVNSRVGEFDTLYYLGDMFLNATDEQCLDWLSKVNCNLIYIILGNHESNIYRLYKNYIKQFAVGDIEIYPLKINNLVFLGDYQEIQIGKIKVVLSHYPIHSWNGMNRGSIHLHGHQHNNDPSRNPDYKIGKCFDVGWDWKKDIWSFEEVMDVMITKDTFSEGHH